MVLSALKYQTALQCLMLCIQNLYYCLVIKKLCCLH